jgi:orotidine-5'-phosphate decarboxylase
VSSEPFLFVAIDSNNFPEAYEIAEGLSKVEGNFGFKINLDLILLHGVSMLSHFKSLGKPLFADLKMWNGLRTMKDTLKSLERYGIEYTNVYAMAGGDVLSDLVMYSTVKIFALTVMTHYDDNYYSSMFNKQKRGFIDKLAKISCRAGCDGVILPPSCISPEVKVSSVRKVCPAIRPSWYSDDRHADAVSPAYAIDMGANILVCGSPITKADNKKEALIKLLDEMR